MDDSLMNKMLKEAQGWLGLRLEIRPPREAGESVPLTKVEPSMLSQLSHVNFAGN
jgi:hypothetical protein